MKYDVFISYSRKDTGIVDYIEVELRKRGIVCFVDRSEIKLGDDFAEVISKAIFESEILLFVWSENSNQSLNTANEIALAIDFAKTIISFKIGKFKPDYRLAYRLVRFNRIDALTYNHQQIVELADKVAWRLGKDTQPATTPADTSATESVPEKSPLPANDFYPEMEASYKEGVRALTQFKLQKAFTLLYPLALADYRDAHIYLARITRGKTRMHKLDEQQITIVKADADNDIPLAQYFMGCYYYQTAQPAPCFELLKKAADSGLTLAYASLANCYDLGFGTEMNHDKYLEYVRRGIQAGDIESQLLHARNYLYGWTMERDTEKARLMLEELAQREDPQTLNMLGVLYRDGIGVPADREKAVSYFEQSIALGYIESYSKLAYLYGFDAQGNVTDEKRYIEILMKGAEYEVVSCLRDLAVAYNNGIGVKRNHKQALRWAEKAAQSGDVSSYHLLGCTYYYGTDGIPADESKAWQYLMQGKRRISGLCCYQLGRMCQDGFGQDGYTKKDCIPFYEEAVTLGDVTNDAAVRLYKIYSDGKLTAKNMKKAVSYLQKAADNNYPEACLLYGKLLTDLESDYCNEFKGVKYLKTAAEANNGEALYQLADLSRQGIGLPMDMEQGIAYLKRAADKGDYGPAQLALAHALSHMKQSNDWYDKDRTASLSAQQIQVERAEARAYAEKATEKGYDSGYGLGSLIYREEAEAADYRDENLNQAWFDWQSKAYGHYPDDAYVLAMMHEEGIGTPVNMAEAIRLYKADYWKGNARATLALADIYAKQKNFVQAREWLQRGADLDDPEAKENWTKLLIQKKLEQLDDRHSMNED